MARLIVDEDDLITEAKDRFGLCVSYNSESYRWMREDWNFGHGDARNKYQWEEQDVQRRKGSNLISLTINRTRVACMQIVNSLAQADAAIDFKPTGNQATKEAAETMQGLARHILYASNARTVFANALRWQVFSGLGYWRVVTDYADEHNQDQSIFIRTVQDPTKVYLDPNSTEPDGSDAKFAFIWDSMPKDEFREEWPDAAIVEQDKFASTVDVSSRDQVVVIEYFRRVTKRDRMFYIPESEPVLGSKLSAELRAKLRDDDVPSRMVEMHEVQWFKIAGNEILEKTIWPGSYIPIVQVVGEEFRTNQKIDRIGHVRAMLDAQRMYNYHRSAATQAIGLQTKIPWTAALDSIAGLETFWDSANLENYSYLPYKAYDSQGRALPPPQRVPPPIMPQAYMEATEAAAADMQMVSGQYEATMGEPSNERTGLAIQSRQAASENGSNHYKDGFESALRYTGKILLDLLPRVLTPGRVLTILGKDNQATQVTVNPQIAQAQMLQNEAVIFNPTIGKYEVEATVGPGFLTQRQRSFDAMVQIVTQAPNLMPVIGDLLMQDAPFPSAEAIAERLHNMVPPQALGGPSPELTAAQQQIQKLHQTLTEMVQAAADRNMKADAETRQKAIDVYKAETDRMETLKEIAPDALRPIIAQLVEEALKNQALNAHALPMDKPLA